MPDYKYLIIGGGMTGDAAANGIRHIDKSGSIGIIGSEPHRPYNRPPLSKALWKGEPLEKIWRQSGEHEFDYHESRQATSIDPRNKRVTDDRGDTYAYDKLLLATGGAVRTLPWKDDGIIYFRTLDDYRNLRSLTERGNTFVVIGGGFIGSEIAAALAMNAKTVTMVFPEDGIGARVYPASLSKFLNEYYTSKGITLIAHEGVERIERRHDKHQVWTANGKEFAADGVVAGIGIQPRTELAQAAGLNVSNGIEVDEYVQTSDLDIYAAGDVANFYSPALGKRIRVEHEDNALTMGEIAGKNMAGERTPYHHLPFFYSDLFDLGYEAVGELDARSETVEDWKDKFREGVVYYLENRRVRGVLLWNVWGQVDAARALIAEKGPFRPADLEGRIHN